VLTVATDLFGLSEATTHYDCSHAVTIASLDHHAGFRQLGAAQLAHEPLDALIAAGEAVAVHQILEDGHGVAAAGETQFDASRWISQPSRSTSEYRCTSIETP